MRDWEIMRDWDYERLRDYNRLRDWEIVRLWFLFVYWYCWVSNEIMFMFTCLPNCSITNRGILRHCIFRSLCKTQPNEYLERSEKEKKETKEKFTIQRSIDSIVGRSAGSRRHSFQHGFRSWNWHRSFPITKRLDCFFKKKTMASK